MPSAETNLTAAMERVHVSEGRGTSTWLWRRDLDLLRALYRGHEGGYSVHIRAAVAAMCRGIRAELRATEHGRALLRRLGQETDDA